MTSHTRSRSAAAVCLVAAGALYGCAGPKNPEPAAIPAALTTATAVSYAAELSGKELAFSLSGAPGVIPERTNGAADPEAGLLGWRRLLEPFVRFCRGEGAEVQFGPFREIAGRQVPTELRCLPRTGPKMSTRVEHPNDVFIMAVLNRPAGVDPAAVVRWGLTIEYNEWYTKGPALQPVWLYFTPQVRFEDPEAMRLRAERLVAQRQEAQRERDAQRAVRAKQAQEEEAVARQAREAAAARLAAFRKALKAGDRVMWRVPARPALGYGMVIRFEGDLAFVQFDNLRIAGSNTRFVKLDELLPPEGRPVMSYELN